MKKGIMLALAIVVLVPTVIVLAPLYVTTFTEESRDMRHATNIVKTQESDFRYMKGTSIIIGVPGPVENLYDVTITFCGEFLIFATPGIEPPYTPESIEVRCKIVQHYYDYGPYPPIPVWRSFGNAKPSKVVMLTEEPDPYGKNWESRSFTFIYKGLPGSGKGDIGDLDASGIFKFKTLWRLYPASSPKYEAQVRRRTIVVTITPSTTEPDWHDGW